MVYTFAYGKGKFQWPAARKGRRTAGPPPSLTSFVPQRSFPVSFDPSKLPAVLADAEKVIPDLIQLATDLNALFGGASEAQIKAVFDEAGINPTRICNLITLYNMALPFIAMF